MKILNIFWSRCACLLIIFPNVTGLYVLHPIFAVRMYPFYGQFNAFLADFSFIKIIVALDSSYFKTYKTTPSSSIYTAYCQRYSDYKILVTGGGHLEFSNEKVDEEKWKQVFSSSFG